MLVCNVSLRPRRSAIAAEIAEITAAVDALATGNVVFATLVDDPASVRDHVDAYSGEIMLEAASAAAAVNAGLVYALHVDEAVTALAAQDGRVPAVYAGAIIEAATAIDLSNASIAAASPVTTTSAEFVGPLFAIDTRLAASLLTVINAGKL